MKKDLSIIIPLFNEEESLEELNSKIINTVNSLGLSYELIYIDDGSVDNSLKVLKRIKESNNNINIIQFRKNFGKSAALSTGFKYTSGDLIITMDADLQDEPKEIPRFIEKIKNGYDLVSGWKKNRTDPIIKKISSKIFNNTVSLLTNIKLHDFNCGFKIYRKNVIKNIDVYGELHRFIPVLANQQGFKIGELKIKHNKRKYGSSKYGKSGIRRIKNYLLDIINVLLITKYTQKPLHFFGTIGLLLFIIGFIIGLYLTYLKLLTGSIQNHYPLLMLVILLIITGIQLISLGLMSEIIIKDKSNKYSIKKTYNKKG